MSAVLTGWPEPLVVDLDEDILGLGGRAVLNEARTHRYLLERRWALGPVMTWIMLNPSTADAFTDDPTIRRCVSFTRRGGFAGIRVLNLYGLRSTDPAGLRRHPEPVGPCNDRFIAEYAGRIVVAAWGAHDFAAGRANEVGSQFAAAGVRLLCLGTTAGGHPKHPLARGRARVPDDAPLIRWESAA